MKSHKTLLMVLFFCSCFLTISRSDGAIRSDPSLRTKEFVVMGYEGILRELDFVPGAYLRTLGELLKVPPDQSAQIILKVSELSKTHPNIMDFAEQVAMLQIEPVVPLPSGPGIFSEDKLFGALNHLTRGMKISLYLKTGQQLNGTFDEFSQGRLWMRGAARKNFLVEEILAIQAPQL